MTTAADSNTYNNLAEAIRLFNAAYNIIIGNPANPNNPNDLSDNQINAAILQLKVGLEILINTQNPTISKIIGSIREIRNALNHGCFLLNNTGITDLRFPLCVNEYANSLSTSDVVLGPYRLPQSTIEK